MTDQELFNQAVRVIINQGGPSINRERKQCMYRNSNGRKCVAGHFIPDEKYSPDMEDQAIFWNLIVVLISIIHLKEFLKI